MTDPGRANPVRVRLPASSVAVWMMAKLSRPLAPVSMSPESLIVTPLLARSMPRPVFADIEFLWMVLPVFVESNAIPSPPLLTMRFPAPAAVPPMVLLSAPMPIWMPWLVFPRFSVPVASVPM